jgi:hypothetical protein
MKGPVQRTAALAMLALLAAATPAAWAQTPAPVPAPATEAPAGNDAERDITNEIELTRAAIQLRRQALVTAVMDLEAKEAEAFWPLYRAYRGEMLKMNDRFVALLASYLENYDSLTDQRANKMLDDYVGIEKARASVKSKYLSKFRKVLPGRKVARFFQVDNKLDAVISADLAASIPLAR